MGRHFHLPSKHTIERDFHFVESKIIHPLEAKVIHPLYKDIIKPTLLLPEKALDTAKSVASPTNILILGFGAVALYTILKR